MWYHAVYHVAEKVRTGFCALAVDKLKSGLATNCIPEIRRLKTRIPEKPFGRYYRPCPLQRRKCRAVKLTNEQGSGGIWGLHSHLPLKGKRNGIGLRGLTLAHQPAQVRSGGGCLPA